LITSKQNTSFKLWQKLKLKKYRDAHDMFLVYGEHLISKAKEHHALVEVITSDESKEGTHVDKSLMDDLQQAETYFDVIGICKKTNPVKSSNQVLILDDIQDPDNLGALLRSAAAFNFLHVIISHKSADAYNEKAIRASKGSLFDVYIERRPLIDAICELKNQGYHILIADPHQQGELKKYEKIALVLGNEGHGVSEEIKKQSDLYVSIETKHVESLNVSVAGAILMYEWRKL
jgi:TrmH family RNA methyltransferase